MVLLWWVTGCTNGGTAATDEWYPGFVSSEAVQDSEGDEGGTENNDGGDGYA